VPKTPSPGPGHHSKAALAARRANLLKARAAPQGRIYRSTEKRRAASRRNLAKAQAALLARPTSARMNALKHGLFAREFSAATLRRLGENPREHQEMLWLFRRVFRPRERPERELVTLLAETCWRRLRLFRAQAVREREALRKALASMPAARRALSEEETELRAHLVVATLFNFSGILNEALKLQSEIECLLRALLRKRSSGTLEFRMVSPRRESRLAEVESLALGGRSADDLSEDELIERLRYLRPERILAMNRRQWREEEERELAALLAAPETAGKSGYRRFPYLPNATPK
jgi:hypothetical protein